MQNKIIAVTGGIGTGKTLALNIIAGLGYPVIDCDQIVKELYTKRNILRELKKLFPRAITGFFKPKADKKVISEEAFSDAQKHRALTEFFAPKVLDIALSLAEKFSGKVFIEVPLLFELEKAGDFDAVIVITREKLHRIEGVMERSNLTREQVLERIKFQFDYENADLSKHIVIENDGTAKDLKEKLIKIIEKI